MSLSPQLPYYLLLFLLTVILRMIRAYKTTPVGDDTKGGRYFYFGFELVNVSAGVFILLSEHVTKYVASFLIIYVILVVVSFFLEDDRTGKTVKLFGNLMVSFCVLAVTIYAFVIFDGLKEKEVKINPSPPVVKEHKWKVGLPYLDTSLNRNFNAKTTSIQSFYVTTVISTSRSDAIQKAKERFYSSEGVEPFIPKVEKSVWSMIVLENEAVAEILN